jgi:hypothetical protein
MTTENIGDPVIDTGQAETDFQATDIQRRFRYKNGISGKLVFERVNEVTWKLTNGEMTNVPASHGYWAGYRTTKAVAWVIEVAAGKWLARCGDRAAGPSSLKLAKDDALAMAKGAHGDYLIQRPIEHLNGLTARLLDAD